MNKIFIPLISISLLASAATVHVARSDDILGVWTTQEKDARIEIYKCGVKYCGRIVWLKEPNYSPDSKEGLPGTPVRDRNNPDPELRQIPLLGLPILRDFEFIGGNQWKNGKIYNSDNGKTYNGRLTLVSRNILQVKGFIGISLIGGSTIWTRKI